MSAAGRTDTGGAADPKAMATAIQGATFVQLVAIRDGDALAAAGLLAQACSRRGMPYHVRAARTDNDVQDLVASADIEATSIVLGAHNPTGPAVQGSAPAATTAYAVAHYLEAAPDPTLALAGAMTADTAPDAGPAADAFDDATQHGLTRRPGVATPVKDPVDGLAHSTLVHAPFSGDAEAVQTALANLEWSTDPTDDDHRRLASWIAIEATRGDASARAGAATTLGRVLHPHAATGPFETLGGYADVLSALAARSPGLAVALAVGSDSRDDALAAWRDHGRAAHAAVRKVETARYGGLLVARVGAGPLSTVARLIRDFRSPEPTVLAVRDGEAAVAAEDSHAGTTLRQAADALDGSVADRGRTGYASFGETTDEDAIVTAFREAQ